MKNDIKVPGMGESITEVTIGSILVPSGAAVKADDPILELETDKVNQQLYATQSGVLTLTVKTGDNVKIEQVIGFIDSDAKAQASKEPEKPKQAKEEAKEIPVKKETPLKKESTEIKTSLRQTKDDFLKDFKVKEPEEKLELSEESMPSFLEKKPAKEPRNIDEEGRETRRKMSTIRKVIAKRMVESQKTAAMLTTFNEIDMTQVIQVREKYKDSFMKKYGVKLGFMPFFIKATVAALHACKDLNSYIDGDDIVHREYFDISVAIGTDKGVMVPVIRNCDHLSFAEIEMSIDDFAKKAKGGTLSMDELQGGGFTITNGGVYGSLLSTPILNPPQSGILGMHKIEKRPVVVDDQIVIRSMMYVALSYDHRIVDGKEAVTFLVNIKNTLEDLSRLLIDI